MLKVSRPINHTVACMLLKLVRKRCQQREVRFRSEELLQVHSVPSTNGASGGRGSFGTGVGSRGEMV